MSSSQETIPLPADAEPENPEHYLLVTEEAREGGKTVFVVTGTVSKTGDYLSVTFSHDTMGEALDTARWLSQKFRGVPIYERQAA